MKLQRFKIVPIIPAKESNSDIRVVIASSNELSPKTRFTSSNSQMSPISSIFSMKLLISISNTHFPPYRKISSHARYFYNHLHLRKYYLLKCCSYDHIPYISKHNDDHQNHLDNSVALRNDHNTSQCPEIFPFQNHPSYHPKRLKNPTSSFFTPYFFLLFSASFRIVPICLSFLVFLPSLLRNAPSGRPCFFSKVPTVQSLLVFLAITTPPLS